MAPALPILDAHAERRDARTLADAQRLADAGDVEGAHALLAPMVAEPHTKLRAQAALLAAGLALSRGHAAVTLDTLARVPAELVVDVGFASMLEAAALRMLQRHEEAVAAAERAVAYGETPGRLLVLADAQKHAGLLADAIATLERLLASAPHDATALAQLAGYLFLSRDRTLGASFEERFESCAPAGADSERGRAFIALTRGDVDAAVEALERAFALDEIGTRHYVRDEVELTRHASDPRVGALLLR